MTLTHPSAPTPAAPAPAPPTTEPTVGALRPSELARSDRGELDAAVANIAATWQCRPAVAAALWWKQYSWYVVNAALDGWELGELPDLGPDTACVWLAAERPIVTITPPTTTERPAATGPAQWAEWLRAEVLTEHLAPIVEQLHARTRVGRRLLWGSVAHAIALPLARRVPEPADFVPRFLRWIGAPVDGLVEVGCVEGEVVVTRRTCCLAFRGSCASGEGPTLCAYCPVATRQQR